MKTYALLPILLVTLMPAGCSESTPNGMEAPLRAATRQLDAHDDLRQISEQVAAGNEKPVIIDQEMFTALIPLAE
ncbi:MAG: hypothetical protein Q4P23_14930 [Micrococcaceae bacterium]|nr:hypothetical protein [Micrococcaceae bacterium]